jgi:lipoprotein-anchoring transpeptidase ErfK/SrfK
VDAHREPSSLSDRVQRLKFDEVFPVEAAVLGEAHSSDNRIWYRVSGLGYVQSSAVQPVRDDRNLALPSVPPRAQLVEVTVPFVDARWRPRDDAAAVYRFYYGTTHWINGLAHDPQGRAWYRVLDDKYRVEYYARAEAFRPVPLMELTPISPDVPPEEKRVEVSLSRQWIQCFEGDRLVLTARVSTGTRLSPTTYRTPTGSFLTFRKRASRHMALGNRAAGYDLPGVPWVAYITQDGVAFHGTYWHNDFGTPRSHGCINMTPEAAKWLYRWTLPVVPAEEQEVWVNYGSRARVVL